MLQDLRRIKQQGPNEQDLIERYTAETDDGQGETVMMEHDYIPSEVLGNVNYDAEPDWQSLPQMPYMEFYRGLQQRNWTSEHFDASAQPWDIKFYRDSGRFLRPIFPGFRAQVTRADGSQCWVDLPNAGTETYVHDHIQPTVPGSKAQLQEIRVPKDNVAMYQYGYNQIFQQLFQAYEQQIPKAAKREFQQQGHTDLAKFKYSCPGENVGVSFHMTPQEASLARVWQLIPAILFFSFAFSFLAVCLGLGIFRWGLLDLQHDVLSHIQTCPWC